MRDEARLEHGVDSLTMVALKSIRKGEEILNDYGPLPRSDLLRRYGYVTDNYKEHDVVELGSGKIVQLAAEYSQLQVAERDTRVSSDAKYRVSWPNMMYSSNSSKNIKSSKRATISRANLPIISI